MIMNREQAIRDYVESLSSEEVNQIASMLSQYTNEFTELEWYPMEEFNLMYEGMCPFEIAKMVDNADFNPYDDWFRPCGYNCNLESASDSIMIDDVCYWRDDVINFLIHTEGEEVFTGNAMLDKIVNSSDRAMFNDNYDNITEQVQALEGRD